MKDIYDGGTLGQNLLRHLRRHGLPRYQWTFCEGTSRLRFVAYSDELTLANGLCFLFLCVMWLRSFGIEEHIQLQTDWGEEFGGKNIEKIGRLNREIFAPIGATLCRYPLGRKGYNGRVERSHRTDDEEFYIPLLLQMTDEESFLRLASKWEYYYNVHRPHLGKGMNGKSPLAKLRELGYDLPDRFGLLPPVILDRISVRWLVQTGNDLLAQYR